MAHKKIPLYSLVLLIIAAIDSIRNLPSTALFGSALLFFFILSAVVFLIPTALVSAELSATFPEKGGVYHWVHSAFGEKWAMVSIWLQWINTMVWYPTILSFIAGTAAYFINPDLAQNKVYLVSVILIVFWGLTLINLRGIHISTRINNVCASIGTVFPMLFLIALGFVWVTSGKPLQIQISADTVFPSLGQSTSWISLIAIMASFVGMELAGVHVSDIRNPQRNFPKAVIFACFFILVTMLFGSLTIAFVLPSEEINLVAGVIQVFSNFFDVFGMRALTPVLTVLIVVGTIGGIINWLISPAKGLLHAAEFGFLPPFFSRKNEFGIASNILLAQAVLVSLFCLIFFLVPSVNGFYWFLTALSTELYMIMYILMFLSALRLHYKHVDRPKAFKIPGGSAGMWTTILLGLFGCSATIAVSFLPPEKVNVGSPGHYILLICIGNILTIAPVFLFFIHRYRRQKVT
ncbi:MAG TPA: APC family permease [Rhabdochlamydiaceae bacterium]|nr:APC family permease [Rhabdochlamydiaceae bacterium]